MFSQGYYDGNSPLSGIDVRIKLVVITSLLMAAMLSDSWFGIGLLTLSTIVILSMSKLSISTFIGDIRSLWLLLVFTVILHLVLGTGDPILMLPFGMSLTFAGINRAAFYALKICVLICLISAGMRSTHPSQLGRAFIGISNFPGKTGKILARFAMIFEMSLRFVPLLLQEGQRIKWAQAGRGLDINKGLRNRFRSIGALILPLISSSFQKVDTVTSAMYSRGYRIDQQRSTYSPSKMRPLELIIAILFLAVAILAIAV